MQYAQRQTNLKHRRKAKKEKEKRTAARKAEAKTK
jgi:hypothetical protein